MGRPTKPSALVRTERITQAILVLRGQKILLDADLAALYGVTTGRFNEAVKRNRARFPADFMFQLTEQELAALRSQIATSNIGRGGRRYAPYAFTEHGAIMAATILSTARATEVSVYVVRAFVQLREVLATHKELVKRLDQLETRIERKLATHDQAITGIITAIRELMARPEAKPKRPIGFVTPKEK
jgi:phage regulator Rha-like protein